jgi:hypothetical protein
MHAQLETRDDLYMCATQEKFGARWIAAEQETLTKHKELINRLINEIPQGRTTWVVTEGRKAKPFYRIRVRKPKWSITVEWVKDEGDPGHETVT